MNARNEYTRLRAKGWTPATNAWRAAKINAEFDELDGDLVKVEEEPEFDLYDDSYLDDWGLSPSHLAAEKKELHRRINNEGVWILVAYFRESHDDEWRRIDSVGGFIGSDWKDSGYDVDLKETALRALREAQETAADIEADQLASRATYAAGFQ